MCAHPHKTDFKTGAPANGATKANGLDHEWSTAEVEAVEAGHASIVLAIPIEKTTFAQQIGAIVDSEHHTAVEKLVMLKTRMHANHRTLAGAYPSLAPWPAPIHPSLHTRKRRR